MQISMLLLSAQQINFLIFMKILSVIFSKLRANIHSRYPDYKLRQVVSAILQKRLVEFLPEEARVSRNKVKGCLTKCSVLFDWYCSLAKATLTLIPLFGIHEVIFIFATDEQTNGVLRHIKLFFTLFISSFQVGAAQHIMYCCFKCSQHMLIKHNRMVGDLSFSAGLTGCCALLLRE